jgi:hypothetical protein
VKLALHEKLNSLIATMTSLKNTLKGLKSFGVLNLSRSIYLNCMISLHKYSNISMSEINFNNSSLIEELNFFSNVLNSGAF